VTGALVDAHQHFWRPDAEHYPWLTPALGELYRTFTPDDLEPSLDRAGIDRTILVQSMNSAEDTEAMLRIARAWPRVGGIVGWVPLLDLNEAERELDWFGAPDQIVGIRHLVNGEPDPEWLAAPALIDSLGLLAKRRLVFEIPAVTVRHLEHVIMIADRHPDLGVVIDHLGSPPIKAEEWQPWAGLIAGAAQRPNVSTKLAGLSTLAAPQWSAADLAPYVAHALEAFGANRIMFGSDWPVCLVGGGYERWWSTTTELLAELSADERAWILGGTATSVYRLDDR